MREKADRLKIKNRAEKMQKDKKNLTEGEN